MNRNTLFDALEQVATLQEVRDFLKDRSMKFSAGSWERMRDDRLGPALQSGDLRDLDIYKFIAECEEHGRQHVFLYRCKKRDVARYVDRSRVRGWLRKVGAPGLIEAPQILYLPKNPTLSEVRWEAGSPTPLLVIKRIERRVHRTFLGEERKGKQILRRYEEDVVRAVNLWKLRSDGLLELRVQSHRNSSMYGEDVSSMWQLISELIPLADCTMIPLTKATDTTLANRERLASEIRFSDSRLSNDRNTRMMIATGEIQENLFLDEGADKGTEVFLQHGGFAPFGADSRPLAAFGTSIRKLMKVGDPIGAHRAAQPVAGNPPRRLEPSRPL